MLLILKNEGFKVLKLKKMSIKEKYYRYKISDWLTLLIGLVISGFQIYRYGFDLLGNPTTEIVVAVIWLLLILAPKTINDVIRKARGLDKND